MFYDDIYPQQLTGTASSGQQITLPVCPPAPDIDLQFLQPGQVRLTCKVLSFIYEDLSYIKILRPYRPLEIIVPTEQGSTK